MVAFNFYHDKYGFETSVTAPSARKVAEEVHFLLGAQFEEKKLQLTPLPAILGVACNLGEMILEIKKNRNRRQAQGQADVRCMPALG